MNPKKTFYIVTVLWLLVFTGFIAYKEYTLQTGTEVVLKTVPVDPRDLFRGDYVILNYEISRLDLAEVPTENNLDIPGETEYFDYGDRIYLGLGLDEDGYGFPDRIYIEKPKDRLYLTGTIVGIRGDTRTEKVTLLVEYGIESYFVPEGRGRDIEKERWDGKAVDVEVVVDSRGNAVIKNLLIDGGEVEF